MKPIVVIPALNPDAHLLQFVEQLDFAGGAAYKVVVVDDGSSAQSTPVFWRLVHEYGCTVLHHRENRGKGAALKTAFAHVLQTWPGSLGCVTADADGQHSPKDILALAKLLEQNPRTLLLGTRNFGQKGVPAKSRWGNRLSALLFRQTTGLPCADTQTGLRGIPMALLPGLSGVAGERFEYEMNVLFYAAKQGIPLLPVPIETIYRNKNAHSHFRPLRDSRRVYAGFARYGISSLAGAVVDLSLFGLLTVLLGGSAYVVLFATLLARLASGGFNFVLNKKWVFKSAGNSRAEGVKYLGLFLGQMALSAVLVSLLSLLVAPLGAKIVVDTALFFLSYAVQSRFVFREEKKAAEHALPQGGVHP